MLEKLEQKDGLYPVVTNVYDQGYTTEELSLRTRRKSSFEQPLRHLKSKIKDQDPAKQNLDPKATTNLLIKGFAAIVFSVGEMLDGTPFHAVGNVEARHILLINKPGPAIGS